VRNFEYYTGPVFRLDIGGVTLAGGGRYNDLIGLVGGRDVPASGFALEMDAVMSSLPEIPSQRPRVIVRPRETGDMAPAATFALTSALREAAISFRISAQAEGDGGLEAVVGEGSYTLRSNGSAPRQFAGAAELVQALTATHG
jgi:histidyl-tRNA synthetase